MMMTNEQLGEHRFWFSATHNASFITCNIVYATTAELCIEKSVNTTTSEFE